MEIFAIAVSTISMVIMAVALWFTVTSFRRQLQLNFFADYTKRYQEIILKFPESINDPNFSLERLEEGVRESTLRYMRAYFDLCSEEYFLWREGNIDEKTWREWESGIKFAFSKPAFQQSWKKLRLDSIYYGSFTKFVDESIADHHA